MSDPEAQRLMLWIAVVYEDWRTAAVSRNWLN
jgi:hypothetical protein